MTVVRTAGIVLTIASKTLFYSKKRSEKSAPFHFGELSFEMSEHAFGGVSAIDLSPISSVFGGIRLR